MTSPLRFPPVMDFGQLNISAQTIYDQERLTRNQKKEVYNIFQPIIELRKAESFPNDFPESRVREETAGKGDHIT